MRSGHWFLRILIPGVISLMLAVGILGVGALETVRPLQPSSVEIEGLFPEFGAGETNYVSRCGRGAPPIHAEIRDLATVEIGSGPVLTRSTDVEPGVGPGQDFPITVTEDGQRSTYRVRCLPEDFPEWRFESLRPAAPGLFVVSVKASRDTRPWVIVFDEEGVPRWWFSPDTRVLWAQILGDGTVAWARSFGDGYGRDPDMAHEIRSLSGDLIRVVKTRGSVTDGHELQELPNGNLLLDTYAPAPGVELKNVAAWKKRRPPDRGAIVFAEIQEIDPQGRVAWRWNSRGHIRLGETGRWWRSVLVNAKQSRFGDTFDPVHLNSIDPAGVGLLVISARHTDAIYGIDRSSGEILWKLGGTRTPQSLRIVGDPATRLLGGPHDARVGKDGRLTIFDNGKGRPRLPRVVSYRLDLRRRTATYLGQLNDPLATSSHCCGSARELADGGWLVSWGDNPLVTAFDAAGRITFRLHLAASTFRAVPVPPDATTTARLEQGLEQMEG
jgi:Arylsulfotransferase (ASST)